MPLVAPYQAALLQQAQSLAYRVATDLITLAELVLARSLSPTHRRPPEIASQMESKISR